MRFLIIAGLADSLVNFRGPLLRDLVARGHEVHAAAPLLRPGSAIAGRLEDMGVVPHDLAIRRTGTAPTEDIAVLWRMYRLMRRVRPDAVMGYTIKPVIWGMLAAGLARVPHRVALITGLGHAFGDGVSARQRMLQMVVARLYKRALRRAHVVIFQNRDDLALFCERGILRPGADARVVDGSGVDLDHFVSAPLPARPLRFVLVARMIGAKGIREFAEAARHIREQGLSAHFDLIGGLDTNPDGVAETELQSWQRDGLLTWHGHVEDVRPFIQAAHVCVLPSYYREGVPRSLLEALAMGRIIITTDMPGCREVVDHAVNGLLVPPKDADALTAAMTEIINAPPSRLESMAQSAFDKAKVRFDVKRVNTQMLDGLDRWHRGAQVQTAPVLAPLSTTE